MRHIDRRKFLAGSSALTLASLMHDRLSSAENAHGSEPLYLRSASELSSLIANGDVSSEQVVRAVIERQEAVNESVNAVVWSTPPEQAIAEARSADQRRARGKRKGSLDGIPFTMKDNIETAGITTTNGCPELKNYVPARDASLVQRLRNAGAILLGKTNVPEMCMDGDTDNLIFGRTKNPYNLDRVPGGSSGGEAAIIALGGSPFGVGTDIGGSIRSPSHCCGIAGIKTTTGRVPDTGMFASFHPSVWHWNGLGPMARTVEDLALVLRFISGPDGSDPKAAAIPLRDHHEVELRKLRILVIAEDGFSKPTAATELTVRKASAHLKSVAMSVEETVLPFFHHGVDRWLFSQIPYWAIAIRTFRRQYAQLGNSPEVSKHHFQTEWLLKFLDEWNREFDAERRMTEQLGVREFTRKMTEACREFDVVVTPVSNDAAAKPTSKADYSKLSTNDFDKLKAPGHFTHPFNLLGWPGAVVRCGTSDEGLPIGLQVVAKPWREDLALAVASALEEQLGGWRAPSVDN